MAQRLRHWLAEWLRARREATSSFCEPAVPGPGDSLVLWCEYGADPTWRFIDGRPRVSPVRLDALALTEATKAALRGWARTFEEIAEPDAEPAHSSGMRSSERVSGYVISLPPSCGRTST
jgi:hypothetical protein